MDYNLLISSILDLSEMMMENGAEVSRVEDTITRICAHYGFLSSDVHAINSSIIITAHLDHQQIFTQARRIKNIQTNLQVVEQCNELSREICAKDPVASIEWIDEKIQYIQQNKNHNFPLILFGWALVAFSFAFFFSGGWMEAIISSLIALCVCFVQSYFNWIQINKVVENIILSALACSLAFISAALIPQISYDIIIISNIMLLIPGLSFCNGIKSITVGDTISGILTLCDALLRAFSIGLGYTIVAMIGRLFL